MPPLLRDTVRNAIRDGRYVATEHATRRLLQRRCELWQAVEASLQGKVVMEHPAAQPLPKVVIRGVLPDGAEVRCVWSWSGSTGLARLVTVYLAA